MAENTPFWCIPTDTALPFACYAADTEPKRVQNERKRGLFSRVSSTHLSLRPLNSQSVSRPNRHTVAILSTCVAKRLQRHARTPRSHLGRAANTLGNQ